MDIFLFMCLLISRICCNQHDNLQLEKTIIADGRSFYLNSFNFIEGTFKLTLSNAQCLDPRGKCSKLRQIGFLLTKARKNMPIPYPTDNYGQCHQWFSGKDLSMFNKNDTFFKLIQRNDVTYRNDVMMWLTALPKGDSKATVTRHISNPGEYRLYMLDCGIRHIKPFKFQLEVWEFNIVGNNDNETLLPHAYAVEYIVDEPVMIENPPLSQDLVQNIKHSWQREKGIQILTMKNLPCLMYKCARIKENEISLLKTDYIPMLMFRLDGFSAVAPLLSGNGYDRIVYNHFHFVIYVQRSQHKILGVNIVGFEVHPYSINRAEYDIPICTTDNTCREYHFDPRKRDCQCWRDPVHLNNSDPHKLYDVLNSNRFAISSSSEWVSSNISWEQSHQHDIIADENEIVEFGNVDLIQTTDNHSWHIISNSSIYVSNFEPSIPALYSSEARLGKLRAFSVLTERNFEMISCFRFPTTQLPVECPKISNFAMEFYQESQNTGTDELPELDIFGVNDPDIINHNLTWEQLHQSDLNNFPKVKIDVQGMGRYINITLPHILLNDLNVYEKDFAVCIQAEKPVGWWLAFSSSFSRKPPRMHLTCFIPGPEFPIKDSIQSTGHFYYGALWGSIFGLFFCLILFLVYYAFRKDKRRDFTRLTTSDLEQMAGIGTRIDGGDSNGGIVIDKDVSASTLAKVVNRMSKHLKSMENVSSPNIDETSNTPLQNKQIELWAAKQKEKRKERFSYGENSVDSDESIESIQEELVSSNKEFKTINLNSDTHG